jgi:hypothetical protein
MKTMPNANATLSNCSNGYIITSRILFGRFRRLSATPRINVLSFKTILGLQQDFWFSCLLPLLGFFRICWPIYIIAYHELLAFAILRAVYRNFFWRLITFTNVFADVLSIRSAA